MSNHRFSSKATGTHASAPASWSAWCRLLVALLLATMVAGCFDFGKAEEFTAPNVTATHLRDIEKRTSIDLPEGSIGEALYFDGTGIDPWMVAKIQIPSDKVNALLATKPFQGSKPGHSSLVSGFDRPWWTPDQMNEPSTGDLKLPNAMVNWTLGQEDKKHVLYIRWDTF